MSSSIKNTLKATPVVGSIGRTFMSAVRGSRNALADWWQHGIAVPALIDVRMSWQEYQDSLSQKASYNLRTSLTLNADCSYETVDAFDPEFVQRFISVFPYRTPSNFLETLKRTNDRGWLHIRAARRGNDYIAIHVIEQYDRYVLCHAPWFDRNAWKDRSLGTFMWFRLIRQAIEDPAIDFLDIGGGPVAALPADHYKRRYNPQDAGYRVQTCLHCGFMKLFRDLGEIRRCERCGASLGLWRYLARLRS